MDNETFWEIFIIFITNTCFSTALVPLRPLESMVHNIDLELYRS